MVKDLDKERELIFETLEHLLSSTDVVEERRLLKEIQELRK